MRCIKNGAVDFLPKSCDSARLITTVRNALHIRVLEERLQQLQDPGSAGLQCYDELYGTSEAMRNVFAQLSMRLILSRLTQLAPDMLRARSPQDHRPSPIFPRPPVTPEPGHRPPATGSRSPAGPTPNDPGPRAPAAHQPLPPPPVLVTVRPDGKISLRLLNEVHAEGLTPAELCVAITEAAKKYLEAPVVSVTVKQINSRKVYVIGMVNKPGPYNTTGPLTILQLIALAGGLQEFADKKNILVVRSEQGKMLSYKVNYEDISRGKNLGQNIELKPGDTVIVR